MPIVLIAGASGSGKTTLAERLQEKLGNNSLLIAVDSYYRDLSHLPPDERAKNNFDHPDSFEQELLVRDLELLQHGSEITVPHYDFKTHSRAGFLPASKPTPVIIIEGIFALYWPELRRLSAHRVFVDTPLETCLERRLERDQRERGRTAESVMTQWNATVKPMFEQYTLPTREHATLYVQGDTEIDMSIKRLLTELGSPATSNAE
jgi:uridine kinase